MAKINYESKSQTAPYDTSKWNAQDANEIKESVNYLYDNPTTPSLGYKSYVCLLSYNPIGEDITIKVLQNELGGDVVWTNPNNGQFRGTLVGAFSENKTWCICTVNTTSPRIPSMVRQSDDFVRLRLVDPEGTSTGTPAMTDTCIEIRVYN